MKWISAKTPPDDDRWVVTTYRSRYGGASLIGLSRYVRNENGEGWRKGYAGNQILAWMDLQPCTDPEIMGEVGSE